MFYIWASINKPKTYSHIIFIYKENMYVCIFIYVLNFLQIYTLFFVESNKKIFLTIYIFLQQKYKSPVKTDLLKIKSYTNIHSGQLYKINFFSLFYISISHSESKIILFSVHFRLSSTRALSCDTSICNSMYLGYKLKINK